MPPSGALPPLSVCGSICANTPAPLWGGKENIEMNLNYFFCILEKLATIFTILGFFVAILATFYIPLKIMINQTYGAFWDAYRSPEMGGAILSVMHFFTHDCKGKIDMIPNKFGERYDQEIRNELICGKKIDFDKTLHFQRRLIAYWYWQLASLRYDYGILGLSKRRLQKDFSSNESKLLSLIYHMGPAARDSFEDISNICEPEEREGPMDTYLYRIYEEAKDWEDN
jgi:hypothetical protein